MHMCFEAPVVYVMRWRIALAAVCFPEITHCVRVGSLRTERSNRKRMDGVVVSSGVPVYNCQSGGPYSL